MPIINPQELPAKGKILAIDVGTKWLGLAVCDSRQILASPRPAFARTKWKQDITFFKELIKKENIIAIVIGLPLTLKGEKGNSANACESYADLMEKAFNLPTVLWDERFTTAQAQKSLFEQRTGRQKRASKKAVKNRTDSSSAVLILQGVLELRRGGYFTKK